VESSEENAPLQQNEMNTFHNSRKCNQPGSDAPTPFASLDNFPRPVETVDARIGLFIGVFEGDDGLVLIQRPDLYKSKD
jgi:hypothetical protein